MRPKSLDAATNELKLAMEKALDVYESDEKQRTFNFVFYHIFTDSQPSIINTVSRKTFLAPTQNLNFLKFFKMLQETSLPVIFQCAKCNKIVVIDST